MYGPIKCAIRGVVCHAAPIGTVCEFRWLDADADNDFKAKTLLGEHAAGSAGGGGTLDETQRSTQETEG